MKLHLDENFDNVQVEVQAVADPIFVNANEEHDENKEKYEAAMEANKEATEGLTPEEGESIEVEKREVLKQMHLEESLFSEEVEDDNLYDAYLNAIREEEKNPTSDISAYNVYEILRDKQTGWDNFVIEWAEDFNLSEDAAREIMVMALEHFLSEDLNESLEDSRVQLSDEQKERAYQVLDMAEIVDNDVDEDGNYFYDKGNLMALEWSLVKRTEGDIEDFPYTLMIGENAWDDVTEHGFNEIIGELNEDFKEGDKFKNKNGATIEILDADNDFVTYEIKAKGDDIGDAHITDPKSVETVIGMNGYENISESVESDELKSIYDFEDGTQFTVVKDINLGDAEDWEWEDYDPHLKISGDNAVIPKGATLTVIKTHGPGGGWPQVSVNGGDDFDFVVEDDETLKEIGLKPLTNMSESMEEIDRQVFGSLNKETREPGVYYVLVDQNFDHKIYADSDEEAIEKFRAQLNESLSRDEMFAKIVSLLNSLGIEPQDRIAILKQCIEDLEAWEKNSLAEEYDSRIGGDTEDFAADLNEIKSVLRELKDKLATERAEECLENIFEDVEWYEDRYLDPRGLQDLRHDLKNLGESFGKGNADDLAQTFAEYCWQALKSFVKTHMSDEDMLTRQDLRDACDKAAAKLFNAYRSKGYKLSESLETSDFEERKENARLMHEVMMAMNDEDAYFDWIYTMPDEPDEDDFEWFAGDDEEYKELVDAFNRIYNRYKKHGLTEPSEEVVNFLSRNNLNEEYDPDLGGDTEDYKLDVEEIKKALSGLQFGTLRAEGLVDEFIETLEDWMPLNESKQLNEGGGAGYEIRYEGQIKDVSDVVIDDITEDKYNYIVACHFNMNVEFDEISAESYYYGGTIDGPIDSEVVVKVAHLSLDKEKWNREDITETVLANEIKGHELSNSSIYGGGWTHNTYDGTIVDSKYGIEIDYYGNYLIKEAYITNKEIIDCIDEMVRGPKDVYITSNNELGSLEDFDTMEEAMEAAKNDSQVDEIIHDYVYRTSLEDWDYSDGAAEVVWTRDANESLNRCHKKRRPLKESIKAEDYPDEWEEAKEIINNLDCYVADVDKSDLKDGYVSILMKDKNSNFSAWVDCHRDKYGDVTGEWNQYIFYLRNSKDIIQSLVQDSEEAGEQCLDGAVYEAEEILVETNDLDESLIYNVAKEQLKRFTEGKMGDSWNPKTYLERLESKKYLNEEQIKKLNENFHVVDLEDGESFGDYEDVEYAKAKAVQYTSMFNAKAAVVDDDNNVIDGFDSKGRSLKK